MPSQRSAGATNALTVFLPPDAFADVWSVLQTEKPIFVNLPDKEDLDGFHLTSSSERVG